MISADEALQRLKAGNRRYLDGERGGDVSPALRLKTAREGQTPYAVVVACSDSRVVPEHIFSVGIGELFVIRVAGNVMDRHQLGSIEYALSHLGCRLVVVLGHTGCGAVGAALKGHAEGYIAAIAEEIALAAAGTTDEAEACRRNVLRSVKKITASLSLGGDCRVLGAVYRLEDGEVTFF